MAHVGPWWDDVGINCRPLDGDCALSPCDITLDDFICALRSLAPEGPIFDMTYDASAATPVNILPSGAVCGYTVGCEQKVVDASCVERDDESCDPTPPKPQVSIIDAYATSAYTALQSLCSALKELDPCTADMTIDCWLARYGFPQRECTDPWPKHVAQRVVCALANLQAGALLTGPYLSQIAAKFGASIEWQLAGDFNCNPPGVWLLGRDRFPRGAVCPPEDVCDPDSPPAIAPRGQIINLMPPCTSAPVSLNIIVCRDVIQSFTNCLAPYEDPLAGTFDEDLFQAFLEMLKMLLPKQADICVLLCDEIPCWPEGGVI